MLALELFSDVYGRAAMNALEGLICQHRIRKIVLARLRLRRIVSMDWHPTDFWLMQISKLRKEWEYSNSSFGFPEVCTAVSLQWKKRALMSTPERRRNVKRIENGNVPNLRASDEETGSGAVLILDDVLTSGGTLQREWLDLQEENILSEELSVHALTLFRTPLRSSREGSDH
ncbi:MAG: hypothetical protein RIR26_2718 [Pseudomonadota bacterium]